MMALAQHRLFFAASRWHLLSTRINNLTSVWRFLSTVAILLHLYGACSAPSKKKHTQSTSSLNGTCAAPHDGTSSAPLIFCSIKMALAQQPRMQCKKSANEWTRNKELMPECTTHRAIGSADQLWTGLVLLSEAFVFTRRTVNLITFTVNISHITIKKNSGKQDISCINVWNAL